MTSPKRAACQLCGEPMPDGEQMFKYHGYSGPCPKPPKPKTQVHAFETDEEFRAYVDKLYEEWRNRADATEDFDEWKVAEIRRLRGEK